jgi:tetratricopeptide (TPR) repeat protein
VQARGLKLITAAEDRPGLRGRTGRAPILLGLVVLAAAAAATWLGADRARQDIDVRALAESALATALERGSGDPEVHAALVDLRRTLGWRPLESKTRVVYGSLLLGLATRREDMALAAFHAARAADLAPVTVPVVRAAALVLANTGEIDRSLALVRRMFSYDPARAAATLSQIDALVLGVPLEQGVPDDPDAWTAWARQLQVDGRREEALDLVRRTHERWPDHVPAWVNLARTAFSRGDWVDLERLLPPEATLPTEPAAAPLHVWRGHLALRRGDREEAVAAAETALRIAGSRRVGTLAGDLFERAGEWTRARSEWNRVLHDTPSDRAPARRALLVRLARLEDRHGSPAAALRLWEDLLEIDPDHGEARRRVDDLTGFRR